MTPILTGIVASGISGHLTPPWAPEGAFDALASVTVGSGGAASIAFNGIPSGYKHLQIRAFVKDSYNSSNGAQEGWLQFNSDTASNYSYHRINGNGSTTSASAVASNTVMDNEISIAYGNTQTFGVAIIDILDYTDTSKFKTVKSLNGADLNGSGYVRFASGCWRSTSAVTSIVFGGTISSFAQYSSFALYGVK
jgi:hypothetical protein